MAELDDVSSRLVKLNPKNNVLWPLIAKAQWLWGIIQYEIEPYPVRPEFKETLVDVANTIDALFHDKNYKTKLDEYGRKFHDMGAGWQLILIPQREKLIERDYWLLIIVHDWFLRDCEPIDQNRTLMRLGNLGFLVDLLLIDKAKDGAGIIKRALNHVQQHLREQAAKGAGMNTAKNNKEHTALLKPSPKDISEIIEKCETLKTRRQNLEKMPLDFPKCDETELSAIKRLVNAAFRQSEILTALFAPDEIKQKLPNLSVATLETLTTLLNQKIPKLKSTNGKIRELQKVQYFAKSELEKKIREAEMKRWGQQTNSLIAEIDLDLTPYRPYLLSIYPALGQFDVTLLNVGCFVDHSEFSKLLYPLIHDLKRIKRIREKELKADLAKKGNTAETGQENKAGKKLSQWKPLKGYIGSKTIVNNYQIPRSTLQGWAERDSAIVKKDPQTKENYYQIKWLDKHRKNYRPRQNTT